MDDYEVRNEGIEQTLKGVGYVVHDSLPEGWGFMLMIFSFGEGGSNFYISDAKREDMARALKEFMQRNELW